MKLANFKQQKTLTFEGTDAEGLEITIDSGMSVKEQLTMNNNYKGIGKPEDPNFFKDSVSLCISKIKDRNLEDDNGGKLEINQENFSSLPGVVAKRIIDEIIQIVTSGQTTDEKKNDSLK